MFPQNTTQVYPSASIPSSLVRDTGITSSLNVVDTAGVPPQSLPSCPDGGWLKGVCEEHATIRWVKMSCKRRTCPVCGQARRSRIAWRIAEGISALGGEGKLGGAGWFVGTFDRPIDKAEAVRISNQFVQWLNRFIGRTFKYKAEWAKVWERHRSGRLHLNLIISPWRYIPHSLLKCKWHTFGGGIKTWVTRVGRGVGAEAAKSRCRVGDYFGKLEQMVLTGRGVSYSKGFPMLPKLTQVPRRGEIDWRFIGNFAQESIEHWYDVEMGYWQETSPGEWRTVDVELCDCFEFKSTPLRHAESLRRAIERMKDERG